MENRVFRPPSEQAALIFSIDGGLESTVLEEAPGSRDVTRTAEETTLLM